MRVGFCPLCKNGRFGSKLKGDTRYYGCDNKDCEGYIWG